MCNGLVMIYMGVDGTNFDHMWGTLDGTGARDQSVVENTLCHQLGYDEGHSILGRSVIDCAFDDDTIRKYVERCIILAYSYHNLPGT